MQKGECLAVPPYFVLLARNVGNTESLTDVQRSGSEATFDSSPCEAASQPVSGSVADLNLLLFVSAVEFL